MGKKIHLSDLCCIGEQSEHTASVLDVQAGNADLSHLILTYDEYVGISASAFVGSNSKFPENCVFNGICMKSFNIPPLVKGAIDQDVPIATLNYGTMPMQLFEAVFYSQSTLLKHDGIHGIRQERALKL
jgi:hypothetical protein